jgi:hypothetical protein
MMIGAPEHESTTVNSSEPGDVVGEGIGDTRATSSGRVKLSEWTDSTRGVAIFDQKAPRKIAASLDLCESDAWKF